MHCFWIASVARIATQERLRDHDSMSRALIGLHWLPVDKRIEYKLMLYTYKPLHDLAQGYLCELVVPYVPRRVLRSAELNWLTVPPGKPGKYGSRSFARASANVWNSLRGERATWLKNNPTLERWIKDKSKNVSLLGTVLELRSATFSSNVYHCILLVSLYVIHVILFGMFTILDYSSALEYSIIRRYPNIVYYYYYEI